MGATPVVALIGAGGIARPHLDGWSSMDAEVRIFSADGAAELASEAPTARAVTTLQDALDGADAVDICTPTLTHPAMVRAAVGAGIDVFCEKPLARTAAEAAALVMEAELAGVRLLPGHVVRWFPEIGRAHV